MIPQTGEADMERCETRKPMRHARTNRRHRPAICRYPSSNRRIQVIPFRPRGCATSFATGPMGKAERSRLARERIGHIKPIRAAFGHRRHDSGTDAGNTIRDLRHFRRPSATWEAFRLCRPATGVRLRDGANCMRVAIQVDAVAAPDSGIFANASSVLARASWIGFAATSNLRNRHPGLLALSGDRVGAGCRNVHDQKRKSAPETRRQTIRNCRRRK